MARAALLLLVALHGIADGSSLRSRTLSPPDPRVCNLRGGEAPPDAERTYAMIKPDVAGNAEAVAAIKEAIADAGLTIEREEPCTLTREQCETFYAEHRERPFFAGLVEFMSSGPVLKLELSGPGAIKAWRALIGPTNSEKARAEAPESLRARFGTDGQRNCAHGSDAPESAERELQLMFSP